MRRNFIGTVCKTRRRIGFDNKARVITISGDANQRRNRGLVRNRYIIKRHGDIALRCSGAENDAYGCALHIKFDFGFTGGGVQRGRILAARTCRFNKLDGNIITGLTRRDGSKFYLTANSCTRLCRG